MDQNNANLSKEKLEKINKIELELGVELTLFPKENKPNKGEYYKQYEDDRL
ncbi:hypothetical protein [Bacillus suaedae]|uniref:Uncharacterized protein n=1 Tax=Halalkalibacter suaedae TaxID=2822140 RepID=A0A941ATW3_9BACI|nr:hypothetical protein [Bacillus suaedae]MBP3952874.1 hypothetical protein [Bacillus suaedae]